MAGRGRAGYGLIERSMDIIEKVRVREMADPARTPGRDPERGDFECPNCGSSRIIRDHDNGKVVCATCGHVVGKKFLDRSPDRRST